MLKHALITGFTRLVQVRTSICIFILLFCAWVLPGQITLHLSFPKGDPASKINYPQKHTNLREVYHTINDVLNELHHQGYLLAEADSVTADSLTVRARISSGKPYRFARLKMGNLSPVVASRLGISEKLYTGKPFRYRELAKQFEKILTYYEDHGYPFATVSIDSVDTQNESISGVINVQKNKFYKLDSIIIIGNAKIKPRFLNRYLGIRNNDPYNERAISAISNKIKQLPFVTEKRPPEARLTDKLNKLYLFLERKQASQFDGIVGLLPDAATGKTTITGDVKLKLINGIFRHGETVDIEWRRLQTQTQDFAGNLIYPYMFGTPAGVDYAIKIYRRDSSFIDVNNNIGLQYYFSGLNNFKVFYRQRASNLISTSSLRYATELPDYADVRSNYYGFGLYSEKVDYRFNPRKGIILRMNIQTGNRHIRKNPNVNEVVYEGLLLRSVQYQADGLLNAFVPLYRNHVLRMGIQGASIFGNSVLFRNELFRIGGLKTLRGFDEESVFASSFVIPTIEYRFLFEENSNLLLFAEGAWYENNSNRQYLSDMPLSVGAGINFETRAGILSINYAIGSQFGGGLDARSGKIHFGLTALF